MKTKKKHYGSYLILDDFWIIYDFSITLYLSFTPHQLRGLIRSYRKILRFNGFTINAGSQFYLRGNQTFTLSSYHVSRCFSCHGLRPYFKSTCTFQRSITLERPCPDALRDSRSYFWQRDCLEDD